MSKRHVRAASDLQPLLVPRTGFILSRPSTLGLFFRVFLAAAMATAIFCGINGITTPPGGW